MGFSIIIPVKEINDYIRESVPITLGIDYDDFEILILPNEMPEQIEPILQDPRVRIIASGRVSPAIKRDLGAEKATYEYLAFMDDDAYPTKNWLKIAEREFRERDVAAIGGPGVTPIDNTIGQRASGLFFETLVGGGGMDYRYKAARNSFYVDDFPTVNLIVRKDAFFAVGGFDNHFWPGEDTKFCLDLIKRGYKIWYCHELVVYHHRRNLLYPHLKQVGNYGKHRGYFAKTFPETSARLTYFAPSIFLLGNLALFAGSLVSPALAKVWLALLAVYFLLATIDVGSRTRNPAVGALTVVTIFCSHIAYGAMFLRGLCSRGPIKSQLR